MGILGSILGKRDAGTAYRTIDGGHPAPYPDMTDEQLYNYEIAFNVAHKTFDRPPEPSPATTRTVTAARTAQPLHKGKHEPFIDDDPGLEAEPVTGRDERVFDAPRYARPQTSPALPSKPPAPPLDFSRPVRLITTKQAVEIITTRARHPVYKVHGYIGDDDVVTVFTSDGRLSENGLPYLENEPQMDHLYLNIYLNRDGLSTDKYVVTQHASREAADAEAAAGAQKGRSERLTCVDVQIDI